jgi:lactoylglutathione lyase
METAGHETPSGVRELRLAVTAAHWEAAVAFYRDELGLRQLDDFSSDRGRVVLLDAGRATLELVDEDQAAFIDEVEVGRRVAGPIRVALKVDDAHATFARLTDAGGAPIAPRPAPRGIPSTPGSRHPRRSNSPSSKNPWNP